MWRKNAERSYPVCHKKQPVAVAAVADDAEKLDAEFDALTAQEPKGDDNAKADKPAVGAAEASIFGSG